MSTSFDDTKILDFIRVDFTDHFQTYMHRFQGFFGEYLQSIPGRPGYIDNSTSGFA